MNKCIEFKSKLGNHYVYDDITGHIFYSDKGNTDSLIKKYRNVKIKTTNEDLIKTTSDDVKKYLIDYANGFKQLILEITSQCNLRCKYCTYSDNYEFTRAHGFSSMDFNTAKEAVDYYFKNFKLIISRNPRRVPVISFYGGGTSNKF